MAFQLSPGVNISEIDLTTVVPAVATTEAAIAGVFRWGPTNERILITSEVELVTRFGRPTNDNYETFFTAANFLSYSDALYVTRVTENGAKANANGSFEAAYDGDIGNALGVAYANTEGYFETTSSDTIEITPSSNIAAITTSANTGPTYLSVGDLITVGDQQLKVSEIGLTNEANAAFETLVTLENKYIGVTDFTADTFTYQWGYANEYENAPGTNELHVVVFDKDGSLTGTVGTILEKYTGVSTSTGAKNYDGSTNYIVNVLEQSSRYIRISGTTSGEIASSVASIAGAGYELFLGGDDGEDESTISVSALAAGYDLYNTSEVIDISLLLQGKPRGTILANYLIDNIAERRRDCVVFISPAVTPNSYSGQDVVSAVANIGGSSYAVVDSGYRYQYDKYNDVYRWTPMNGDIAGLCARTDDIRDPWFSPAGYNRGSIKNVVKLALNPTKAERDLMYKKGVNPVITQPGQGTILFGDKTYLNQPSAFDRINVRRLFIVLEKAIAVASKRSLFEFNDEFTRAQFRNLVEPFLRDVQGRRGIYDFRVVCDTTNNTPEIIDRNEFVGDIYVKPARSINFIQLNFIAVRTGVEFSEIVGQAQ